MADLETKLEALHSYDQDAESRLGFVIDCLFAGAITRAEFRQWCLKVIEKEDTPHHIFFELIDFDGMPTHLYRVFKENHFRSPHFETSSNEENAITGIGFQRGTRVHEDYSGQKSKCLEALKVEVSVLNCFKSQFTFISI